MNKIIALLGGGLGNRIPPLCSAMRLAELYGRDLYAWWSVSAEHEFLVEMPDVFGGDLPFRIDTGVVEPEVLFPTEREGDQGAPVVVPPVPAELNIRIAGFQFFAHERDHVTPSFEARDAFMLESARYFHQIPLSERVLARLDFFERRVDLNRTLGVHVRRQALQSMYGHTEVGRDWWHVDAYIRAIEVVLDRNPDLEHIYVASNRQETREYIAAHFPGRAILNDAAGDGWSTAEMQAEAFVEMLILSRCAVVLRQVATSFSLTASVLGGNRMVTLHTFDPETMEPSLEWTDWRDVASQPR